MPLTRRAATGQRRKTGTSRCLRIGAQAADVATPTHHRTAHSVDLSRCQSQLYRPHCRDLTKIPLRVDERYRRAQRLD